MANEADWVAVDWGTSNLRVWGIGAGGDVAFARTSDQGMSKLTPDAYPRVLSGLLAGDFAPTGPRIDVRVSQGDPELVVAIMGRCIVAAARSAAIRAWELRQQGVSKATLFSEQVDDAFRIVRMLEPATAEVPANIR